MPTANPTRQFPFADSKSNLSCRRLEASWLAMVSLWTNKWWRLPLAIEITRNLVMLLQNHRLGFKGMLFGPGLPKIKDIDVPAHVPRPFPMPTGVLITSPDAFDSCDFVNENAVMKQYSSVVNGR